MKRSHSEQFGYVYETINQINGKFYIGQCHGKFLSGYLGSGCALLKAVMKHGKPNFSVRQIVTAESQRELDDLEIHFIQVYREKYGYDNLYNRADGGWTRNTGWHHTPESKEKIRTAHLGRRGYRHTPEAVEKIRAASIGRPKSKQTRELIRQNMTGHPGWNKGIPHTLETRNKISVANTGKIRTQAQRLRISKAVKGRKLSNLHKLNISIGRKEYLKNRRAERLSNV